MAVTSTTGNSVSVQVDFNPYQVGTIYGAVYAREITDYINQPFEADSLGGGGQYGSFSGGSIVGAVNDPVTAPFNEYLLSATSVPVTSSGTKTITFTGLSPDQYAYIYLTAEGYSDDIYEIVKFVTEPWAINTSGNALEDDVWEVGYSNEFSGSGTSVSIPLAGNISAGQSAIIDIVYDNTSTISATSDPDNIIAISGDTLNSNGATCRRSTVRIQGWLNNGNYGTVTFNFNGGSSVYTGSVVVYAVPTLITPTNFDDEPDNGRWDRLIFGAGFNQCHKMAALYTTDGGAYTTYPLPIAEENALNQFGYRDLPSEISQGFYPQQASGGDDFAGVWQRYVDSWTHSIDRVTEPNDARFAVWYIPPPLPDITSGVATPDVEFITITFGCQYAVGRVRAVAYIDTNPNARPASAYGLFDATTFDHEADGYLTRPASTQSIVISGLLEKRSYDIFLAVECFDREAFLDLGTILTLDGPNETVFGITEVLAQASNAATVSAVYNPPTIVSVLPDVWQDGLEVILVNTTNITSHEYTRVWVYGVEQEVTAYAKNQITITARQETTPDGDYTLYLTDYIPSPVDERTWLCNLTRVPDPLAADVSLYFDAQPHLIGETNLTLEATEYYTTTTNGYTDPLAAPEIRSVFSVADGATFDSLTDDKVFSVTSPTFNFTNGLRNIGAHLRPDASVYGERVCVESWTIESYIRFGPELEDDLYSTTLLLDLDDRSTPNYTGLYLAAENPGSNPQGVGNRRRLTLRYNSQGGSSGTTDYFGPYEADKMLQPEKWHHLAVCRFHDTAATIKVYLDGKLVIDFVEPVPLIIRFEDNFRCYFLGSGNGVQFIPTQFAAFRITFNAERYAPNALIYPRPMPRYI
jgi:hypothetical protein